MSTLDNFKKEAKRWLKALRAHDADARERLVRAYPQAPAVPGLRDVQHALAREHGHRDWTALKAASDQRETGARPASHADRTPDQRAAAFLQAACWDHHTHGKADHRMYDRAAQRMLAQDPAIARHSLYTAVVCGDLPEVRRILDERPDAAREPGGVRGWTPLLYLSYARFTHQPTIDRAVEMARLLLDAGANPNDFYVAGDSEYSALVGVAGEGEQDSPRQPYAEALYALLLERGAGPYDIQVLYNTHFSCDMIWWLALTYQYCVRTGRKADWDEPDWSMFDMGGYGSGAHFVLNAAVQRNHLELAEWALAHGASPNSDTSANPKFTLKQTVYEKAVVSGLGGMADLLRRHGATVTAGELAPEDAFLAACMRLDRRAAEQIVVAHPEFLRSHRAMFEAAKRDRPDVIALLLDLGVPLEIEDRVRARALHHAAGANALRAAACLLERGAEVDPRETSYGATPIGWASHGDRTEMIEFLSRYSTNIWTLAFRGHVDRVREILREDPDLAKQVTREGITPLWWLPDDERKAMEIVELLLAAGADPAIRSGEGRTAADWARERGMAEIAQRLTVDGDGTVSVPDPATTATPQDADLAGVAAYERLADALVAAYNTGDPEPMRRLAAHFGTEVTMERVRTIVPQRLEAMDGAEPIGDSLSLSNARLLIARDAGYDTWAALEAAGGSASPLTPPTRAIVVPPADPSGAPVEMRAGFRMRLQDNSAVATADVWSMLVAAREGHLERVRELADATPSLTRCEYNYMPPLHLAVREGHIEVVRFLAERGAVHPKYVTYPYTETLLTVATDRGYGEIGRILEEHSQVIDPDRPVEEVQHIEYETDFERRRFERLVGSNALTAAEQMLEKRPDLVTDPFAFWAEGIMSMPANRAKREMLDLLLRHGARVPDIAKWGREYYFKHYDIGAFLLERGMNPNHMNCHRTTLLHGMAQLGDVRRATLLIDHGADLDAVDEEFRSTPLGFAARWGHHDMVRLLLDRGADRHAAAADWAMPRVWARKKGYEKIAADLG